MNPGGKDKDLVGKGLGKVRARIACGPANTVSVRLTIVCPRLATVRARLACGYRGTRLGAPSTYADNFPSSF